MNLTTDTHAHLYYPEILADLENILTRAKDSGIEKIIVPAVDVETSRQIIDLSEKHEMIYCAVGIHPCDVQDKKLNIIEDIEKLLNHEKVVGIGETGLDYYWDKSNLSLQKEFFKEQIKLAISYNLPVIIHTRESIDDAIQIVEENYSGKLKGQFHCFSGNLKHLEKILNLRNFFISFCGNITYKNYSGSDIISKCPLEKLLSETDSPFLPPVPFRGKKNEPSYVFKTLEKISGIKNVDYENFLKILYSNSEKLFFSKKI